MERIKQYKKLRNIKSRYDNSNKDMLEKWIENHLKVNESIKNEQDIVEDLKQKIYNDIQKQINEAIERLQKNNK